MERVLKEKLWAYLAHNNPELLFRLEEDNQLEKFLSEEIGKISDLIDNQSNENISSREMELLCMDRLTAALRPSRYRYILSVLEEEFPSDYEKMSRSGELAYEVIQLVEACKDALDVLDFSERNYLERHIRYATIAEIHGYLN